MISLGANPTIVYNKGNEEQIGKNTTLNIEIHLDRKGRGRIGFERGIHILENGLLPCFRTRLSNRSII